MHFVLLGLLALTVMLGPNLWVRWVMGRHGVARPELEHTGASLARMLVADHGLGGVTVEPSKIGDHYDPNERAIRLSPAVHDRRSVAALAVAAHEFGHALQHAHDYHPLVVRSRILSFTGVFESWSGKALLVSPLVLTVAPGLSRLLLMFGAFGMLIGVPATLINLPVEFDASFGRALPLIEKRKLLSNRDMAAAKQVLTAAAFTYVAGALGRLLSIRRWFRVLTRR